MVASYQWGSILTFYVDNFLGGRVLPTKLQAHALLDLSPWSNVDPVKALKDITEFFYKIDPDKGFACVSADNSDGVDYMRWDENVKRDYCRDTTRKNQIANWKVTLGSQESKQSGLAGKISKETIPASARILDRSLRPTSPKELMKLVFGNEEEDSPAAKDATHRTTLAEDEPVEVEAQGRDYQILDNVMYEDATQLDETEDGNVDFFRVPHTPAAYQELISDVSGHVFDSRDAGVGNQRIDSKVQQLEIANAELRALIGKYEAVELDNVKEISRLETEARRTHQELQLSQSKITQLLQQYKTVCNECTRTLRENRTFEKSVSTLQDNVPQPNVQRNSATSNVARSRGVHQRQIQTARPTERRRHDASDTGDLQRRLERVFLLLQHSTALKIHNLAIPSSQQHNGSVETPYIQRLILKASDYATKEDWRMTGLYLASVQICLGRLLID